MKWNEIEQNWKQMQGEFKQEFNKLSDQELQKVGGKRRKLEEVIEEEYNVGKTEASKRVDKFIKGLKNPKKKH